MEQRDDILISQPAIAASASGGERRVVLLYVIGFVVDVAAGIVVVALPYAARHLGAEVRAVGLVGGVYMGGYALGCLKLGALIDHFRPRGVLICGVIGQALLALGIGFAPGQGTLIACAAAFGVLMVAVWPPLMSWLSHACEGAVLNRRLSWFNVSWCSGLVVGPYIGGGLFELSPLAPFAAAAAILVLSALLTFLVTEPQPDALRHRRQQPLPAGFVARPDAGVFRFMARVSVVVCTAMAGVQRFQVPLLAESLHIGPAAFGRIILTLSLGNMICFLALGRTQRWHYRASLLWGAQLVLAAAMGSLAFADSGWHLATVATVTGLAGGVAYSSSLYYGVSGGRRRAALAAIHEMLLSAGFMMGAIGGGELSQRYGLVSPYRFCALVLVGAVLIQVGAYTMVKMSLAVARRAGQDVDGGTDT